MPRIGWKIEMSVIGEVSKKGLIKGRHGMSRLVAAFIFGAFLAFGAPAQAIVVPLNIDNNGVVLTDPAQIVDVDFQNTGGNDWTVSVGDGLNFEQFFFNFSVDVGAITITTPLLGAGWSLVVAGPGGGTAGNFGKFSEKIDGPVAVGSPALVFSFTAAGVFDPNAKGNTFAAKISSEAGGNAGGFVSNGGISPVPLPAAIWLFMTALVGLGVYSRRRAVAAA